MFRLLLDQFDAAERKEFSNVKNLPSPPKPKPDPEPEPIAPVQKPKPPRKPRPKRVAKPNPAPEPVVETVQAVQDVPPTESGIPEPTPPAPKPKPKPRTATKDQLLDRLSRMRTNKREDIMNKIEELSKEPEKISEIIKSTRGRLKILKTAEELLNAKDSEEAEEEKESV